MIIKALLVLAMLAFGYIAARGRPSAGHLVFRRSLAALVLVFGIIATLVPSAVTWLAHLVGVGRGTDLVLYVLAVSFLMVTTTLLQRISELERRYVLLARRIAIDDAARRGELAKVSSDGGLGVSASGSGDGRAMANRVGDVP